MRAFLSYVALRQKQGLCGQQAPKAIPQTNRRSGNATRDLCIE